MLIGCYSVVCTGDVPLAYLLTLHRLKFPEVRFQGHALSVYADAMLRLSIRDIYQEVDGEDKGGENQTAKKPKKPGKVVQSSLEFASSYPIDLRLLMCDQQRGYGSNPIRSWIEAWRNPTKQMGGGGTVDTNTWWYADAEGVDAPTAHLSLSTCVRAITAH